MRNLALMWVVAGGAVALLAADDGKPSVSTFTDKRDGKVYRIVEIGSQTWFAENLNYAAEGSRCYNNSPDSCAKYGRLYDWRTSLTACPAGTHLSTDDEWTTLVDYVGGVGTAGKKLKSKAGWNKNGYGTDDYGFSALPGGYDNGTGSFDVADSIGYWWSATEGNTSIAYWWGATEGNASNAWGRYMHYNGENVGKYNIGKTYLFYVRCVADDEKEKKK